MLFVGNWSPTAQTCTNEKVSSVCYPDYVTIFLKGYQIYKEFPLGYFPHLRFFFTNMNVTHRYVIGNTR